ncbi:hypothetical protein B0H14DRAFT_3477488 [Mycena olivaceomarginata]|nr:hypothetical protein B0H14DRAFT_3477488 [Mycena olivaceomarginata]
MSPPSDTTHVSDSEPERIDLQVERRIAAIERELGGLKRRMRDFALPCTPPPAKRARIMHDARVGGDSQ